MWRSKLENVRIHKIKNDLEAVVHPVTFHAPLQVKADRHDKLGIIGNLDDFPLQLPDQNVLVLRLVNGPMLSKDIFVAEELLPQQGHLAKRLGDMQMNQVRLEETFFDVFQSVLVHPQHLQFSNGVDFWRTDINLHMGMVRPGNLLDLERFRHVLAVADGEDDGMAILGQCVNHADAEVAQGGIIGGREPTQ